MRASATHFIVALTYFFHCQLAPFANVNTVFNRFFTKLCKISFISFSLDSISALTLGFSALAVKFGLVYVSSSLTVIASIATSTLCLLVIATYVYIIFVHLSLRICLIDIYIYFYFLRFGGFGRLRTPTSPNTSIDVGGNSDNRNFQRFPFQASHHVRLTFLAFSVLVLIETVLNRDILANARFNIHPNVVSSCCLTKA